jgi:hypothetical protein
MWESKNKAKGKSQRVPLAVSILTSFSSGSFSGISLVITVFSDTSND